MAVTFCPIASGSSGNSIYIGTETTHMLIDAGISGRRIESGLAALGRDAAKLDAIFITHEHTDHIQGAGVLSRRFDVPVYASAATWAQIDRHSMIGAVSPENKRTVAIGANCLINDIRVNPFAIPHDCAGPVGYAIYTQGRKIAVATDLGHGADGVKACIAGADALLIESNHDVEMLRNGPYPQALKRRIAGEKGHLSNVGAGQLLTDVMSVKLKHVFLGHLSAENNRPLLALDTVTRILEAHRLDGFKLTLAQRDCVSEPVVLI